MRRDDPDARPIQRRRVPRKTRAIGRPLGAQQARTRLHLERNRVCQLHPQPDAYRHQLRLLGRYERPRRGVERTLVNMHRSGTMSKALVGVGIPKRAAEDLARTIGALIQKRSKVRKLARCMQT